MAQDESQVISINKGSRQRLPKPVQTLSEELSAWIAPRFHKVLDKLDDSLFDQAEKSTSNKVQQLFFDAMRLLRIERKGLESNYIQQIELAWLKLSQTPVDKIEEPLDLDNLGLVQKDDMEQQVILETMARSVSQQCGDGVEHIAARIASELQLPGNPLEAALDHYPVHPLFLGTVLAQILDDIDIDISIKLIIFKIFHRELLNDLPAFIRESNDQMIQAGILPMLSQKVSEKKSGLSKGPANSPQASQNTAAPTDSFSQFQQLNGAGLSGSMPGGTGGIAGLAPGFTQTGAMPIIQGGGQVTDNTGGLDSPVVGLNAMASVPELVTMLGNLQGHLRENQGADIALSQQDVQQLLQQQLQQRQVNRVDGDALNLVSMLFDVILNDSQLSLHMKELLGRLQIPMLKVAVLDHQFFTHNQHPARSFLNHLAKIAGHWGAQEDDRDDRVFQQLEMMVLTVINEFDDDLDLFDDLNEQILQLQEKLQQDEQLKNHQLQIAEEARAKQLLAEAQAKEEVITACEDESVPAFIAEFLHQYWVQVLQQLCLTDDFEHDLGYDGAVAQMNLLIWSVQPGTVAKQRSEFLRTVPSLLRQIRQKSLDLSWPATDVSDFFSALEEIHINALTQPAEDLIELAQEPQEELSICDEVMNEEPAENSGLTQPESESLETEAELLEFKSEAEPEQSQVIDIEFSNVVPLSSEIELPIEEVLPPAVYALVDKLAAGVRFDLIRDEQVLRCKLAAVIKSLDKYILVDRHGLKLQEYSRQEMAAAMHGQSLNMLDDGLLFDRALESVIGSLQKQAGRAS